MVQFQHITQSDCYGGELNMTKKRIYLNAFEMNCSGHQSPGLWTHPEDRSINIRIANIG